MKDRLIFITSSVVILFDQATKYLIESRFSVSETYPFIQNVLHLTLVHNTGGAFGVLYNNNVFFLVASIAVLIIIFIGSSLFIRDSLYERLAVGFIIGGAFGNIIDRVRLGHVIDFIDFQIWPVFNIADSAISTGAVVMIIMFFFRNSRR